MLRRMSIFPGPGRSCWIFPELIARIYGTLSVPFPRNHKPQVWQWWSWEIYLLSCIRIETWRTGGRSQDCLLVWSYSWSEIFHRWCGLPWHWWKQACLHSGYKMCFLSHRWVWLSRTRLFCSEPFDLQVSWMHLEGHFQFYHIGDRLSWSWLSPLSAAWLGAAVLSLSNTAMLQQ